MKYCKKMFPNTEGNIFSLKNNTFIEVDDLGRFPCEEDQDCPENKDWWIDEGCSSNGSRMYYGVCLSNFCDYTYTRGTCQLKDGQWELPFDPFCKVYGWICDPTADLQGVQDCQQYYEDGPWYCDSDPNLQDDTKCEAQSRCESAGGSPPETVSPAASVGVANSCQNCQRLEQCPPNKPCKRGDGQCSRPYCTRRGRCWCPRY